MFQQATNVLETTGERENPSKEREREKEKVSK